MFKFRIYRDGLIDWTSQHKYPTWDMADRELTIQMEVQKSAGFWPTGADIFQDIPGIGWVLCNEGPECK